MTFDPEKRMYDDWTRLCDLSKLLYEVDDGLSLRIAHKTEECLEEARELVATEMLELMHRIVGDALPPPICAKCQDAAKSTDYSVSSTVESNTSSQPSPADIASPAHLDDEITKPGPQTQIT